MVPRRWDPTLAPPGPRRHGRPEARREDPRPRTPRAPTRYRRRSSSLLNIEEGCFILRADVIDAVFEEAERMRREGVLGHGIEIEVHAVAGTIRDEHVTVRCEGQALR